MQLGLLKYQPEMDKLSAKTQDLIQKAADSTKEFVEISSKLSDTNFLTRGAHAKSYAYINAHFKPNADLIQDLGVDSYFTENQNLLVRFSNANNVILDERKNFPAYGMSLRFENDICYPLVNFPLFPTDDVDSFLQLFIDLNEARIAQAQNGWEAIKELPSLISSTFNALFHINPLNAGNVIWKGLQMEKDFLLNYGYHGIGCYRFGRYVGKLHTEKLVFNFQDKDKETLQKDSLQEILDKQEIKFNLYIQLGVNADKTPVNVLSKEWDRGIAPWLELGQIIVPKQKVVSNTDVLEKTSFNPFLNPKELQPVGRIQQTRKEVYRTSYQTRK